MPFLSVIVPNYNHASYLEQRIESILHQTFQDFELILLDDCSTDNSREILSGYASHPKVSHVVFNEVNSGSTFRQWHKGVELAKGGYIWIAESDDWADVSFLETIAKEADNYPDAGLLYTSSQLVDAASSITYRNASNNSGETELYDGSTFIRTKLATANVIWNASMMVFKKSLYPYTFVDRFAELKFCGDWFFYVLLAGQADVVKIDRTLNYFRMHKQNVSTEAERSGKSFSEGLQVYDYICRHYLSFSDRFKTDFAWGKNFYKYRKKYALSSRDVAGLLHTLRQHSLLIYLDYLFYKLYKSL